MRTSDLLFVYGTLRKGANHPMYNFLMKNSSFLAEASINGRLYLIDYYPGLVLSKNNSETVLGEVYRLFEPERLLQELDEYEECGVNYLDSAEYKREIHEITLADGTKCLAWLYLYIQPVEQLMLIESGDFISYLQKNTR